MVAFDRPVGAEPDTKEIEYIAALHQSGCRGVRPDGSIQDVDIKIYLRSRFGIEVTIDQVRNTIMKGMGGGTEEGEENGDDSRGGGEVKVEGERGNNNNNSNKDDDDDDDGGGKVEAVLDLMELVAILMIPLLVKAAIVEGGQGVGASRNDQDDDDEDENGGQDRRRQLLPDGVLPPPDGLLRDVADMLTHDATGDKEPKPLTADLVRNIFLMYGEKSLADDKTLIDEMLKSATPATSSGGSHTSDSSGEAEEEAPILFDVRSFARALTADVQLYDVQNETRQSSIIQDIFDQNRVEEMKQKLLSSTSTHHHQHQTSGQEMTLQDGQEYTKENEEKETSNAVVDIKDTRRIFTAPAIDITAGTYRSKGKRNMI